MCFIYKVYLLSRLKQPVAFSGFPLSFSDLIPLGTKLAQFNEVIGTVGTNIPFPQRDVHV